MSKLSQFLLEHPVENIQTEVRISNRIPFKFKIKGMTGEEFASFRKQAVKIDAKKKDVSFDSKKLTELVIINCTLEPDFRNAEDLAAAGCTTPTQYLYKVLLAGEIEELNQQIQKLSGLDVDLEDKVDEAKN